MLTNEEREALNQKIARDFAAALEKAVNDPDFPTQPIRVGPYRVPIDHTQWQAVEGSSSDD